MSDAGVGSGKEYVFKVVLLGDSGVGKTHLAERFVHGRVAAHTEPTIGVEFSSKVLEVDRGDCVRLQVWDTAGVKRYQHHDPAAVFQHAACALLVYDMTAEQSFEGLARWADTLAAAVADSVAVVVVGNKKDLPDPVVSAKRGKAFADERGFLFAEVSAAKNTNVQGVFELAANAMLAQVDRTVSPPSSPASPPPPPRDGATSPGNAAAVPAPNVAAPNAVTATATATATATGTSADDDTSSLSITPAQESADTPPLRPFPNLPPAAAQQSNHVRSPEFQRGAAEAAKGASSPPAGSDAAASSSPPPALSEQPRLSASVSASAPQGGDAAASPSSPPSPPSAKGAALETPPAAAAPPAMLSSEQAIQEFPSRDRRKKDKKGKKKGGARGGEEEGGAGADTCHCCTVQ
eukprot:Rhum_TRINITY_DN8979_c0_g2::Rhum_TRINITY_DN8979_c0_g2_i1::g.30907::m.30907/K07904/RAB11A; Ras-related protein Rab-11A